MEVKISFYQREYRLLKQHLFKGRKEQAGFLFASSTITSSKIDILVEGLYLIQSRGWDYQSAFHLDLNDQEKVKIMLEARKRGSDLIECHSHRFGGPIGFSRSDLLGLEEFVQYVWWKLPGKIYGAIVFTENDNLGRIWLPKKKKEIPITNLKVID